jgi:plasmid stabilization system protein ParE
MNGRFLAEAEDELYEAVAWYNSERDGLGQSFLRAVQKRFDAVCRQPERFERVPLRRRKLHVRRASVPRFPYSIIFEVAQDEVVIAAIAHAKRRPRYWQSRLQ